MQSCQSGSNDHSDHDAPNILAIPDFARGWESAPQVLSSVRRPSTLPTRHSYHEVIETQAIFELDEKQVDGSVKTILVVPFGCERCKLSRQACSRERPACVRCRKAKSTCGVIQGGYQMLPGPKIKKPSKMEKVGASNSGRPVALGSKRPLSPGSGPVPPRKRAQAKTTETTSRNKKARGHTIIASKEKDIQCSEASTAGPSVQVASAMISTGERSALKWTFMSNSRGRHAKYSPEQKSASSIPPNTPTPRVWTSSLNGLLTVFPELAKAPVGFSWFQSETPILLLDTNYSQGHWIDCTTLSIDLTWDFSCYDFELEPIAKSGFEDSTQLDSHQPVAHSPESTRDCVADTMGLRHLFLQPTTESFPTCAAVSTPQPMLGVQMLPPDGTPQCEQYAYQGTSEHLTRGSPVCNRTQDDLVSAGYPPQPYPSHPLSSPENLPPFYPQPVLNESITYHTTSQTNLKSRIPLNKPPEVEMLLDSRLHSIPLLLWIPCDSELVPCNLPPAYAYSCMGFFFISSLRHEVIRCDVSPVTEVVHGSVCWSFTLQWAPGGEDALFDSDPAPPLGVISDSAPPDITRDTLHPWWFGATDTLLQADNTTPYRPRDLRMQFFSFIPLDLLADFHPSESFPRGWFCKSCGMINVQQFFRHQICRSIRCGSTGEKRVPQGKADSLSSLRDPYQSSILTRPINRIPSVVVSNCITWDDGMQSWIYGVRDGVILCHVFTGNQEHLQEDATVLLEKIQCEVLLRKEESSSLYFTHTIKLSHPSDGSEAMVPVGTPDCARIAYYTLCDFVHRYGEMDKPRFGEVRMQAWVNSGTRKGSVLRAGKSPVVVHCLGAEVVLKLVPRGGYKVAAELTASDKGKGRAGDEDRVESLTTEPRAGSSCHLERESDNQVSLTSGPEAPIVAEHAKQVTAALDTMQEGRGPDAGGTIIDAKAPCHGPRTEMTCHEVVEPKAGRGRKKNKVIKDKSKASIPEISMTLVHGDCVVLYGDNFECQIVRTGTAILVTGVPVEEA